MARRTRIGCLLAVAVLAAACGHSPSAATPAGLSIVSLTAQVQNAADGGYTYLVDYAVRNDASTPTTIVRIDTAVAAKGTPVRAFTVTYSNGGVPIPPAQTLTPAASSFSAPASDARADSLTITVHYTGSAGEQTVSRTTPLG